MCGCVGGGVINGGWGSVSKVLQFHPYPRAAACKRTLWVSISNSQQGMSNLPADRIGGPRKARPDTERRRALMEVEHLRGGTSLTWKLDIPCWLLDIQMGMERAQEMVQIEFAEDSGHSPRRTQWQGAGSPVGQALRASRHRSPSFSVEFCLRTPPPAGTIS